MFTDKVKRFIMLALGVPPKNDRWPHFSEEDFESLRPVLCNGNWWGEPEVGKFTREFLAFLEMKYGVAVNSGTTALELAVAALGIGPGDEVIVPVYTFYSTAEAVLRAGAKPVFVDVTVNGCIDPAEVSAAVTPKTKAVIGVHLGGHPIDCDEILNICREHQLYLIEDVAHAVGSLWKNKAVGSIGDLACFSFQAWKTFTAGEGGFIATTRSDLYEICHSLSNLGRPLGGPFDEHVRVGGNYRLSKIQAAILSIQLKKFAAQCKTREENAEYVRQRLNAIEGIEILKRADYATRINFTYCGFLYDRDRFGALEKQDLIKLLNAEGVPVMAGYARPLREEKVFSSEICGGASVFPIATKLCNELMIFDHVFLLQQRTVLDQALNRLKKVQSRLTAG